MEQQKLVDVERFPFSTQAGLSEGDQSLLDAIHMDKLREMIEMGESLSERQKAILRELETKDAIRTGKPVPEKSPFALTDEQAASAEEFTRKYFGK